MVNPFEGDITNPGDIVRVGWVHKVGWETPQKLQESLQGRHNAHFGGGQLAPTESLRKTRRSGVSPGRESDGAVATQLLCACAEFCRMRSR